MNNFHLDILTEILISKKEIIFLDEKILSVLVEKELLDKNKKYVIPYTDKYKKYEKNNNIFYYTTLNVNKEDIINKKLDNIFLYFLILKLSKNSIDYNSILNCLSIDVEKDLNNFISINKKDDDEFLSLLTPVNKQLILNMKNFNEEKLPLIVNKQFQEIVIEIDKLEIEEFIDDIIYNILLLKEYMEENNEIVLKVLNEIVLNTKIFMAITNFDLILDISNLKIEVQKSIVELLLENDIVIKLILDEKNINLSQYYKKLK